MGLFSRKPVEKRTLEDIIASKNEQIEADDDQSVLEFGDEVEDKTEREKPNVKEQEIAPLNPLDCFFMRGENSEKWLVTLAKVWHYVISVFWFLIGSLTFAPVLYLSYKSNLIVKEKKKSVIIGLIIYAIIVIVLAILLAR